MCNRGVIFDMDGVLVDSYQAHFESWRRVGKEYGLVDITEGEFAVTFGRTSRDIISQLWPRRIAEEQIPTMDARKEQAYRDIIASDFPEMEGAGELIAALHEAGFAMAIGSSGPPENVHVVLDGLKNSQYISAAVTGREVTRGKPDPEVFLLAARKLGLPPERCAVIEDAPAGVGAALRAGMSAIALTGTASREKLARAHLIVDSLRQLTAERIAVLIDAR